jgi:hypothetical protein
VFDFIEKIRLGQVAEQVVLCLPKKTLCFQGVTPGRKSGRVGCIGLRYLQSNANVPGVLSYLRTLCFVKSPLLP